MMGISVKTDGTTVVTVTPKAAHPIEVKRPGVQGIKGDIGPTGPEGPQGVQGEQGVQGPKGDKGDQGIQGIQGPKGDKGDTGAQGIQGVKGDKGDTGDTGPAGTITSATATGLAAGAAPTVTLGGTASARTFAFGIPKGDKGDTGSTGSTGSPGVNGWTPVLAVVADGVRYVQQVVDWTGGTGTKPATGKYVGATGLVDAIGDAVNIRGASGSGTGDMLKSLYDPTNKAGDAFDMGNMVEGATAKIMTAAERTKLGGIATGATANDTDANLKARANHTGTQLAATISDFSTAADARVSAAIGTTVQAYSAVLAATTASFTTALKTKLDGIATGATANTGTVTSVGASVPTGFSVTGPVTASGTLAITYAAGYQGYTTAEANKLAGIAAGAQVNSVTSVAGKTGAVTLAKGDVGLGSVDNTADSAKPVSTAQAAAIAAKVTKSGDTGLGGFTAVSSVDDGTKSSGTYTPDPTTGNWRKITANGGFTLAGPTAPGCYNMTIEITNGASAGAITFSGFAAGHPKGDALTTANGAKAKLHIAKSDIGVTGVIEAGL